RLLEIIDQRRRHVACSPNLFSDFWVASVRKNAANRGAEESCLLLKGRFNRLVGKPSRLEQYHPVIMSSLLDSDIHWDRMCFAVEAKTSDIGYNHLIRGYS